MKKNFLMLQVEWSNYTNWPYNYLPLNVIQAPTSGTYTIYRNINSVLTPVEIGPGVNPDGSLTGILINQPYNPQNEKDILVAMGILLDGSYRENIQPAGVFNYIEKYTRTTGSAPSNARNRIEEDEVTPPRNEQPAQRERSAPPPPRAAARVDEDDDDLLLFKTTTSLVLFSIFIIFFCLFYFCFIYMF